MTVIDGSGRISSIDSSGEGCHGHSGLHIGDISSNSSGKNSGGQVFDFHGTIGIDHDPLPVD